MTGPLELEIPIEEISGRTIHQLAARKAILELEEGRGWIFEAKGTDNEGELLKQRYPSRFDEMVQREAVRLGVRYQVGGKWSSFVAVADNEKDQDMLVDPTPEQLSDGLPSEVEYCEEYESDEDMGYGMFDDVVECSNSVESPEASSPSDEDMGFELSRGSAPNATEARFCSFGFSPPRGPTRGPAGYKKAAVPRSVNTGFDGLGCMIGSRSGGGHRSRAARPGKYLCAESGSEREGCSNFKGASKVSSPSPVPMSASEKVHAIIGMQDFEGAWEYSDELVKILEVNVGKEIHITKEWVTTLVIRWLEDKMQGEKDVWELVVEKARAWLQGQGMEEGMKRLEMEVVEYMKGCSPERLT